MAQVPGRRGFTPIELLVVIAIIAMLISILLPGLGQAREAARQLACSSSMRMMGVGQTMYANSFKEFFAGPTTSGLAGQIGNRGNVDYVGGTTPETPVTTHDWISPTMGESLGLSPNRAQRTAQIFNHFACPAARKFNQQLFGSASDASQFQAILNADGFLQTSYMMPYAFHYWPKAFEIQANALVGHGNATVAHDTPVQVARNYRPRFDLLGAQPSNKVLAADGTRYLISGGTGTVLDFDISPTPRWFGAFIDSGPIFHGSTAYGRGSNSSAAPNRHVLSFRHPGKTIDVLYFDGHVGRMNSIDAWTDARPWYPGRSVFNGGNATPESIQAYTNGINPLIP